LATVSEGAEAKIRGKLFLRTQQQTDGGFSPLVGVTTSNARATAAATLALIALGEAPDSRAWSRHTIQSDKSALPANTPPRALLAWQNADGGFRLQPDFAETDPLSTVQALVALAGRPQPVARVPLKVFLPIITRH
jgi:hypothetical protein